MKKFAFAGAAIIGVALSAPALAADMAVKAAPMKAPVVVGTSWTGCYIGGNLGGAWARSHWVYQNVNPYSALSPAGPITATDNDFTMSGWIGGAQVGCNYEFANRVVIGIEGSWLGADLNRTNPNVVQVFAPTNVQTVTTNIRSAYTIAGRLGYEFAPAWLGYVKGGYASARIDTSGLTTPAIAGLNLNWNTSQWHGGYVVGAGVEYKMTKNVVVGVEYDYIGLNTTNHVGAVSGGVIGPANQIVHSVNGNIQSLTARLSFLFGPGPVVAKY